MDFPNPRSANPDGLLMIGGDLKVETLEKAYRMGIFPWPQEGVPLLWFSPPERGILYFNKFKIPKSTKRVLRKGAMTTTMNTDFEQVIKNCSKIPRKNETGTWILPEMVEAYVELHKQGKALSVEAWQDEKLVGGLYGVLFGHVFSGESMFFKESEASKLCLVHIVEHLKSLGHQWMDIQMVTPLLAQLGGEYVPRDVFLEMLKNKSTD